MRFTDRFLKDPLTRAEKLLQAATVRIRCGEARGTAFFIAPSLILTARHTVERGRPHKAEIAMQDGGWKPVTIDTLVADLSPLDAILLRCVDAHDHPIVYLEPEIRADDSFTVLGFSEHFRHAVPVIVDRLGPIDVGSGPGSVFLGRGNIDSGHSGSPLLNRRTRGVAGLVTHSAGREDGAAISLEQILRLAPQLLILNHSSQRNSPWPRWIPTDPIRDYLRRIEAAFDSPPRGILSLGTMSHLWVDPQLVSISPSIPLDPTIWRNASILASIDMLKKKGCSFQQESELHWLIDYIKCGSGPQLAIRRSPTSSQTILQALETSTKDRQIKMRVEGRPGAGKSTLLQVIGLRALRDPQLLGLSTPVLPLLTTAPRLLKADGPPARWLKVALEQDDRLGVNLPHNFTVVWSRERDAHWLLLIDECEAVPPSAQSVLATRVDTLSKEGFHIVAAARTGYCHNAKWSGFSDFRIQELDAERRLGCSKRWFPDRQDEFDQFLTSADPSLLTNMLGISLLAESFSSAGGKRKGLADLCEMVYKRLVSHLEQMLPREFADCADELLQVVVIGAIATNLDRRSVLNALETFFRDDLNASRLKASKHAELVLDAVEQVTGLLGSGPDRLPARVIDYCAVLGIINNRLYIGAKEAVTEAALSGVPPFMGILQMMVAFTVRSGGPCVRLLKGFLDFEYWPARLVVSQAISEGMEIEEELGARLCDQIGAEVVKNAAKGDCAPVLVPQDDPPDLRYQLLIALRRFRNHATLAPRAEAYRRQLQAIATSQKWRARRDLEILEGQPISLSDLVFDEAD